MAKPRVTATDRLANVIEVVELGQRTGLLSVERGSGSVLEEGELYFSGGRVTYASLAGLRGREALAALGRWGGCRFSFEREVQPPIPNIAAPVPNMPNMPNIPNVPGSQPGFGGQRVSDASGVWPSQPFYDTGYGPGYPNAGGTTPLSSSQSGYLPRSNVPSSAPGTSGLGVSQPSGNLLNRRPRRAPDVRDLMAVVTTHNLSRGHRTILLLADGEHTVLDLARLSSKSVDEVMVLLGELESRGLVYYYK